MTLDEKSPEFPPVPEFPTGRADWSDNPGHMASGPGMSAAQAPPEELVVTEAMMRHYYGRCFPFDDLFPVYVLDPGSGLRLEIAMWHGNRISRWRPIGKDAAAFAATVRTKVPDRIEAGPVYDAPVLDREIRGKSGLVAAERPLTFDLDLDESFDGLRACGCKGTRFCRQCWPLVMAHAVILDFVVRGLYGYSRLLWVYSGRRGLHCWVFDDLARRLGSMARTQVVRAIEAVRKSVSNPDRYARHFRAISVLVPEVFGLARRLFGEYLARNPGLFDDKANGDELVGLVDDGAGDRDQLALSVSMTLEVERGRKKTATRTWEKISAIFLASGNDYYVHKVAFHFCFPRLDVRVTEDMGHLLKFPFCVHPSTGHVCTIIRAQDLEAFYPDESRVPNIHGLCAKDEDPGGPETRARNEDLVRVGVAAMKSEIS